MTILNLQDVAAISAGRALNWIVGGIAIAVLAEILLRLGARQSSKTRFVVWFTALMGIAFLPLAGFFLTPKSNAVNTVTSTFSLPSHWALWLALAWAVGASVFLLRIVAGVLQIRGLRKRSTPIELSSLGAGVRKQLQDHGLRRELGLYSSSEVRVPLAIGFLHPAIILPSWTLKGLSAQELNSVVVHEIAHIRRWDDWTNLAQKVVAALFFFHPAVWWIENRLELEREMACDDVVLSEDSNPREYANCLVSLAEKSFSRRQIGLAQAAVMRMRHIAQRITQILDTNRCHRTTIAKPVLAAVGVVSALSIFASPRIPQFVAFKEPAPILKAGLPHAPFAIARPTRNAPQVSPRPQTSLLHNAGLRRSEAVVSEAQKKAAPVSQTPVLQAKSDQQLTRGPSLHLVKARRGTADAAFDRSQSYFLVIRTRYSDVGEVFWSIGVVQLTVFHPAQSQRQPESSPKSI
jgi:beta-lactamase regulating signal transducer with metallopeptidase domain